jgi:hypothetical protein
MSELTIFEKVEQGRIDNNPLGNTNVKYDNNEIAKALILSHGNMAEAARNTNIPRIDIYRHVKKTPDLQELLEAVRESHGVKLAEMAVDNLEKDLEAGEPWATVQVLNKSRWGQMLGFGERLDITASAKPPEVIEIVRGEVREIEEQQQIDEPDNN